MRLIVLLALFSLACGSKQEPDTVTEPAQPVAPEPATPPEPPTPPEPVAAPVEPVAPAIPDALEAGPDIYKVLLDNDSTRVFLTTFKPGAKMPMHRHTDMVAYVIKPGKLRITKESGESEDHDLKKGAAMWMPAENHAAENPGKKDVQAVVVELKKKGTAAPAGDDPAAIAKKNYKVLFDDEHVRVLEVKLNKKAKLPNHAHPDHVIYVSGAGQLELLPEGGAAMPLDLQAETAVFLPAQAHSAVNTGKTTIKGIIFEIK